MILRQASPRRDDGFTLVELIVVIAVIGILAALAIPAYSQYIEKARIARAIVEIRELATSIKIYYDDHDSQYPNTLGDIGQAGLKTDPKWYAFFLASDAQAAANFGLIDDPWGHPYQYLRIEGNENFKKDCRRDRALNPLNSDFDLYSMGADGVFKKQLNNKDSRDDIVRVNNGGFIGLATDFDPDP